MLTHNQEVKGRQRGIKKISRCLFLTCQSFFSRNKSRKVWSDFEIIRFLFLPANSGPVDIISLNIAGKIIIVFERLWLVHLSIYLVRLWMTVLEETSPGDLKVIKRSDYECNPSQKHGVSKNFCPPWYINQ